MEARLEGPVDESSAWESADEYTEVSEGGTPLSQRSDTVSARWRQSRQGMVKSSIREAHLYCSQGCGIMKNKLRRTAQGTRNVETSERSETKPSLRVVESLSLTGGLVASLFVLHSSSCLLKIACENSKVPNNIMSRSFG
eukprot:05301_6